MSENVNNTDTDHNKNYQQDFESKNLYEKQYEQEQLAGLDENAPQLNAPVDREVNKKAIAFIVLVGFSLAGLGAFAYQYFTDSEEVQPLERAQVVTVPDLPAPDPVVNESPAIPLEDSTKTGKELTSNTQLPNTPPIEQTNPVSIDTRPPVPTKIPTQVPVESTVDEGSSSFVQDGDAAKTQNTAVATTNAVRYIHNKDKLLMQGTYLRCVLETKIVSEISGFTSCIITEPVYSASGKHVLLPKGSKIMGQYSSSNPTSGRLGIIWERAITPDGIDITLKSPGVNNLGAAGHEGEFKSHWPSRLASALLISMISDTFKYAAAEYGPQGETITTSSSTISNPYESETADTLKQLAISQLERNNSRPNTVTINQGSLINIYTAQDIDFSTVMQ